MKPETTAINRTASRLRRFQTIAFNAVTNATRRRSGVKKFLVNKGLTKPATPADKKRARAESCRTYCHLHNGRAEHDARGGGPSANRFSAQSKCRHPKKGAPRSVFRDWRENRTAWKTVSLNNDRVRMMERLPPRLCFLGREKEAQRPEQLLQQEPRRTGVHQGFRTC